MLSYAKKIVRFWRIFAINLFLIFPADAAPSTQTIPSLVKKYLIPLPFNGQPTWESLENSVRWKQSREISIDNQPASKMAKRRLVRDGSTKVRVNNRVFIAEISMFGSIEFPDEVNITIHDPEIEPPHPVKNFDFYEAMKNAGVMLEKSCKSDAQQASIGREVYIVKASGFQPIAVSFYWESAGARYGSSISIDLAYTNSVAKGFECF